MAALTSAPRGAVLVSMPVTSPGVTNGYPAKLASKCAISADTSDTAGILGIVVSGANGGAVSGNVQISVIGQASCIFDSGTVADDYANHRREVLFLLAITRQ